MKKQNKIALFLFLSSVLTQLLLASEGELSLSDAYALALKNDSRIKAAGYRAEASLEVVSQARSRLLPQIQYSYSRGKAKYESYYYKFPTDEMYSYYQISLVQPIFHPEYLAATLQSYSKRDGAMLEYKRQRELLGIDVAKAYFNYLKTKREESLAKWQMEQYESKYRQLDKMLAMGLTNKIDVLEAKISFDKSRAEWLTWQKQLEVAKYALEKMIGEPIDGKKLLEPEKINPKNLIADKAEYEARVLKANTDVLLAQKYLDIAKQEVWVRRYEHYPKVDLRLSNTRTDTKDISAHKYDKSLFFDVRIPIFQGGYTSSRVSEAKMLMNAASEDLEAANKEAKLKFEDLWSRREISIESVDIYKEREKAAALYLDSIEKAYKAGLKSVVDLLEAKAKLYAAKRDLVNSTYELINNQLELLNIAGELNIEKIKELEAQIY